jgi:hypothetical protein
MSLVMSLTLFPSPPHPNPSSPHPNPHHGYLTLFPLPLTPFPSPRVERGCGDSGTSAGEDGAELRCSCWRPRQQGNLSYVFVLFSRISYCNDPDRKTSDTKKAVGGDANSSNRLRGFGRGRWGPAALLLLASPPTRKFILCLCLIFPNFLLQRS